MDDPRRQRAEEIFLEVADLPREKWGAEIDARANGDSALAGEVRSLLDCHADAEGFLDARELVGLGVGLRDDHEEDDLTPGTRLGDFQIESLLGRGGMGSVFVATQSRPHRKVALKVIRRGLATPSLLRRFEHEAEVLGRLHHPGIALIYEAGVARTAGPGGPPAGLGDIPRPYIAMELVNGPPLNTYAETHKLATRDRLELVAKVCEAVHHAHQRGVIHRDLKPANILIDEQGQPKVLDFGVARAADADLRVTTLQTSVGQLIGTLPYMSPEQVLADPAEVDTRSDVYALGVILYQLLTGRLPLDLKSRSIPEAARVIRDETPTKLSHVSRVFRGEIDTIVSKAMDKDKVRRYQSAGDLADDLRRHLRGEPIHARQDSALYLIRAQLRRYRWAVGACAVFLLGLLAFALYAGWSARTERHLAETANSARTDAEWAKSRSEELNTRLERELTQATIERARLEGALGNVPLAEDILWREHLRDPGSTSAFWGLWELYNTFPTLWTVPGERDMTCAAVTRDGSSVVFGTHSESLVFHRGATGQRYRTLDKVGGVPEVIATAPDGSIIAAGLRNGRVVIVPVRDPGPPRPLSERPVHSGAVRCVAINDDGTLLATGGDDRTIRLWDLRTLKPVRDTFPRQAEPISALAFSHDGTMLASACRERDSDVDATVWHLSDGAPPRKLTRERLGHTTLLWFAPGDGALLAASWDRSAAWHDLASGRVTVLERSFAIGCTSVAPSRDGASIYVGGSDAIFGIGSARPAQGLGRQRTWVFASGWLDDRTLLLVTGEGLIHAVDTRRTPALQRVTGFRSWCFSVAYSPDGRLMAIGAGDSTIVTLDAATLRRRAVTTIPGDYQRTRAVRFLSDSSTLVAGCQDGSVRIIDGTTGSITTLSATTSEVYSLAIDPSERMLAVGHADGVVRRWALASRTRLPDLPKVERWVTGIAFSPDGAHLATTAEGALLVWNTADYASPSRVECTANPWALAYSPDGSTLLASTYEGTVDVFDTRTFRHGPPLIGHQSLIPALAYSPDGRFFATGSDNGTLKLWDAATLRSLVTLEPEPGELVTCAFDPSSRYLAASAALRFTAVYDLRAMDTCIAGNEDYQRRRLAPGIP